jgi:DNA mismatch repair protein MutS
VKRDVIEVVTPGVAFSQTVLDEKRNNYLLAVALPSPLASGDAPAGVAFADVTTADFNVCEVPLRQLPELVTALQPSEVLVQQRDREAVGEILRGRYAGLTTKLDDWIFSHEYAYELLTTHFRTKTLKGFGIEEMEAGTVAAGAGMAYLRETQKANLSICGRSPPTARATI